MKKNQSSEANIQAAKAAVNEMTKQWQQWKNARNSEAKTAAIAAYAAAFTNCKVYLENYLKQLFPNESQVPQRVTKDIQKIVQEMDMIEKANEKKLHQAIHDIEQLRHDTEQLRRKAA